MLHSGLHPYIRHSRLNNLQEYVTEWSSLKRCGLVMIRTPSTIAYLVLSIFYRAASFHF